ncbi:glutamine--tRNA ligase/YqeY domain fusion protein [Candidatus Pelagisphaera phototrophica]|uniref:glutamine--tRNA ligase/YqeY domain fusion protein n=1 Tax=Candidatus Pelagisphaera phototrophica TaxID=2684113 RepID=UPI0019F438B4|nr:glutamine--tRNA ligase/YqeY domain fusion protein [Candidatus Pelagisphaera phototrophica]QXD33263.1 glutamine--tRNA ligase/YqeY domain fusion protein [Candidatus Pelagisphaera phototrophica]
MTEETSSNFIRDIIDEYKAAKPNQEIVTRFPPEPNGYLHIGHAFAIQVSYGIARDYNGQFNLRFDDTNPAKEESEYVDAIKEDVKWLGADWGDNLFFASDYFDQLYDWALHLIREGLAYVDDQSPEEMRKGRGSLIEPGENSPFRDRTVEENFDFFQRMKDGEFDEGNRVLRAKIDMGNPNLNLRDPVLYRILHANHHRTGDKWKIYPSYDFTHGQSDAIEGITHSLCSLEFEFHRPLYNWFLKNLPVPSKPRQIEFARLNVEHIVTSKRKLLQLVSEGHVRGWDDPRMPTVSGFRRRGYTPESLNEFCRRAGVAKRERVNEYALLEYCIRQDLEERAYRRMAVLNPVKVIIENFPENDTEYFDGPNHPAKPELGMRSVPLTREIYIEREDFMEDPPKKFFRLGPGREVRLRYACYITCTGFTKDEEGEIQEIHATFDPESRGGSTPDGRKVKGTIHWVSATENRSLEVRNYEQLFTKNNPEDVEEGQTFIDNLNQNSESIITAFGEPELGKATIGERFQFERKGYYAVDPDTQSDQLVLNCTVGLRDSWGKKQKK